MSIQAIGGEAARFQTTRTHEPVESSVVKTKAPIGAFQRVFDGLGKEINTGERLMHRAIAAGGGGELAPSDLLALQAGVYRYGEAIDLASKLIDRTSTGVKTVINGGGQ